MGPVLCQRKTWFRLPFRTVPDFPGTTKNGITETYTTKDTNLKKNEGVKKFSIDFPVKKIHDVFGHERRGL